jgi:protein YibB
MTDNITIVSAFFDIGRGNLPAMIRGRILPNHQHRSVETYFEFFKNLAKIKNDMVIYTTGEYAERIRNIRIMEGLGDRTNVIVLPSYLPENMQEVKEKIQKIMDDESFWKSVDNPHLIEYWHVDYVLINIFKSLYVTHAINSDVIKTDLAAWIDFGYVRSLETLPKKLEWKYPFDAEKIHMFNMREIDKDRPISDIIKTGDVYTQGCHIVGGIKSWPTFMQLMLYNMNMLIQYNMIDDDQTMMLMSYLSKPELFQLRYNTPDDWFRIFKDYNNA